MKQRGRKSAAERSVPLRVFGADEPAEGAAFPWEFAAKRGETRANRNIRWIEAHCIVPEGKLVGKPVVLREWQRAELRKIYDNPAITRRAILSYGRKNGKTALAAFLLLLHLAGPESRENAQLFSAAQSRDQAAILFHLAAKMVRLSQLLHPFVGIRDTGKQLYCPGRGTLYRALSADVKTSYGLSPALVIHDELGQVTGPRSDLYEALETAAGAQDQPLSIVISTQAPVDNALLSMLIDDAKTGADPRTVLSIYTASTELDPFSDEAIKAANPAFGDFLNADEVRMTAAAAQRMPSREGAYRNLHLNQRVSAESVFISEPVWLGNAAPAGVMAGRELYGGLDLSVTNDLTACVWTSPHDGRWPVWPQFWLPGEGLIERSRQDHVPYDLWHRDGFLGTTPGASVRYDFVAKYLRGIFDTCNVKALAFDRFNMRYLKPELERVGFTPAEMERLVDFGQGYVSMSPAIRALESILLENQMQHGGHPVLTMCAANTVVTADPAGNRKFDKSKAIKRIDGMVALAMAVGVAQSVVAKPEAKFQLYAA